MSPEGISGLEVVMNILADKGGINSDAFRELIARFGPTEKVPQDAVSTAETEKPFFTLDTNNAGKTGEIISDVAERNTTLVM